MRKMLGLHHLLLPAARHSAAAQILDDKPRYVAAMKKAAIRQLSPASPKRSHFSAFSRRRVGHYLASAVITLAPPPAYYRRLGRAIRREASRAAALFRQQQCRAHFRDAGATFTMRGQRQCQHARCTECVMLAKGLYSRQMRVGLRARKSRCRHEDDISRIEATSAAMRYRRRYFSMRSWVIDGHFRLR